MKRVFALIFALMIAGSLALPAYAENETENPDCGIIDAAALDAMIDEYIAEKGAKSENISVGYCYTATGDYYYYNADKWYYSASVYKVPNSMMLAEKEAAGDIDGETMIRNQYMNGTVAYLEQLALEYSNNEAGHSIVDYLGGTYSGKNAEKFIKYTSLEEGYFDNPDFQASSFYTPRFVTEVIKTLYDSPERFPRVTEFLLAANSKHYFKLNGSEYEIAQKFGAYNEYNHNTGIIYTPNPCIVTVMTKNTVNYEAFIAGLADKLTEYTLVLDTKLDDYLAAEAAAPAEPEVTPEAATPDEAIEGQPAPAESTPAPSAKPAPAEKDKEGSFPVWMIAVLAAAVVAVIGAFVVKRKQAAVVTRGKHDKR